MSSANKLAGKTMNLSRDIDRWIHQISELPVEQLLWLMGHYGPCMQVDGATQRTHMRINIVLTIIVMST